MTADFSFVTHATQGHAYKLAVSGVSDRLGQRGFTHAWRTDQAQHRATNFLNALLHGEVFEDALFDFFQAVVVGIEDVFGTRQVQTHLALGLPRHLHQPVDVRAHDSGLGGHRRHLLKLVQLGSGFGERVFWQAGGIDALFQLFDFVVAFVAVTELFLNGLHLLIQVVLALAALHLFLHATTNALLDLQQVDLGIQQGQHVFHASAQVDDFEDFLLLLDLQRHVGRHGIDQAPRLIDAVERGQDFSRDLFAQLHILFELRQQAAHEHFGFAVRGVGLIDQRDFGAAVAIHFDETLDRATLLAFDQHLDGAIRQLQQLQYSCNRAYALKSVFTRVIVGRISLGEQQNLLVAGHRSLKGLDGFFATHEQWDHHVRIHHDIAQWQKRQFNGRLHDFASTAALRPWTDRNELKTKMGVALQKNKRRFQLMRKSR